jgi:ribosomal protein L37AE/L43A
MSSSQSRAIRVLHLRVKDKHAARLSSLAREVNFVFNYCNDLSIKVFERERRFLSGFNFWPFLKGSTCGDCGLSLPVQAVQEIAEEYARRRKSFGARRSLGWIPFKVRTIRYQGGQVYFAVRWLSLWDSFGQRFYRDLEPKLACTQRARKRSRTRAIHAKTGQAKSVLDAGWSTFRTMLRYKCDDAGVWFDEVNEAFSTQTCSECKSRTGPQGREGLGIREWQCSVCGAIHDRDVNAAHNILAAGHRRLAEGILVLEGEEDVNNRLLLCVVSIGCEDTPISPRPGSAP